MTCGGVHAGAGHPEVSVVMNRSAPEQVHLEVSVAVVMSVLQQVHLEASVAVHEVMLEHLKACGHG